MRELKFRAWASGDWPQKMVYAEKAHHFTITFYGCAIYDGDTGAGDFILMQFTGLRGKNGKEIYEGDVVKCGEAEDALLALICFKAQSFLLQYLPIEKNKKEQIYDYMGDYKYYEIIGNIYENPELLKPTNA